MSDDAPSTTIEVPGTAVPLTAAVLGTMNMGDTTDAVTSEQLFEAAIDAGITGIDCANGYARGTTESLIAPWVRRHRDRIVLATKAGMPHEDAGSHSPLSPAGLRASVEGSLRRLDVDRIDLFYLHQPDRLAPIQDTLATVAELRAEGKIGAYGVSNFAAWQALEVAQLADELGIPRPSVGQNVYNLVARRVEDEWIEFAARYGIATMCYNPLAGGLIARPPRDGEAPARFEASALAEMYKKRYWTDELLAAAGALARLADEAGLPMYELAMRWLVGRPGVAAVLIGANRISQLRANIDALAKGPLPVDLAEACDAVSSPLKGSMPAYNR
ncbi:aldo/keto reductase [Microbacterium indicum]|uniref:aldo/keto reductase n=1 Tax=Microbacterium indicum TaxID=358100 RepID=UPI0004921B22|nr:aldo/keto reductase [Microbacterium indicum]